MNYSLLSQRVWLTAATLSAILALLIPSNLSAQIGCGMTVTADITTNPTCGPLPPCNCECETKVQEMTVQYLGVSGVQVDVWNKSNHQTLIASFSNVQNGDYLPVSAVGILPGDDFETNTFFEIDSDDEYSINTNCNTDIAGGIYGDFLVVGFTDVVGNVCDALTCRQPCECAGNLEEITIKYLGDAGVDINVWREGAHSTLIASFTNVQQDQILVVSAESLPGDDFDQYAYVEVVGGNESSILTDCSKTPQAEVYGDFEVIAYRDGNGSVCGDFGTGGIDLTVSGNGPFTYDWSNGQTGEDLTSAVDGTYMVTVTDASNCAVAFTYDLDFAAFALVTQGFETDSTECTIELPKVCSCPCTGGLQDLTLYFAGTDGVDINVWNNAAHDILIASYTNVQNGNELTPSALGVLAGDVLEAMTYIEIVGGEEISINTQCDQNIAGGLFGDFQVFGHTDETGESCDASDCIPQCGCNGKVKNFTFQYIGTDVVDINVWGDAGHDILVDSYSNLSFGDFIFVEAIDELPTGGFGPTTYIEIVGGEEYALHTSCSLDAIGLVLGDIRIIHFTDGEDATCNELNCDGSIDINILDGQGPYSYVWSHGPTTQDVDKLCPGNYSVEIFDVNGCSFTEAFELSCFCEGNDGPACADQISSENLACILGNQWTDAILQCNPIAGSLEGATPSPEAVTNLPTGEDRWYMFTAIYPGVSIHVESADFDILIELHDRYNNLLDTENVVAGVGAEILNFGNLIENESYLLAIRAVDGYTGTGDFSVCISDLPDSRCDRFGSFNLCDTFKADWVCADDYIFHYTALSDNTLTVYQMGYAWTFMQLIQAPLYNWDEDYLVEIYTMYHVEDGAGTLEYIIVDNNEPCVIETNPHPITVLDYSDRCEVNGPQFLAGYVAASPWACAATDYTWEFVRTDVAELPIVHQRGISNRFMQLSDVPGLTLGGTYDVRVKPEFITGEDTNYGDTFCLQIVGPAGAPELLVVDEKPWIDGASKSATAPNFDISTEKSSQFTTQPRIKAALYPNPVTQGYFNVNVANLESETVVLEVCDMYGKLINSTELSTRNGQINEVVETRGLAQGVYNVIVRDGSIAEMMQLIIGK